MTENVELEDLVYTYPEYNEKRVQEILSSKEEFREIKTTVKEDVPKRGQLYRHQKFLKRLMMQYDNSFVIWQTGVGKLCGFVAVTEHYKMIAGALEEIRKINPDTPAAPFKRAYILVKGDNLVNEAKFQIVCKCTDGDYITDQILNSKTEIARKSNVTRSVGKFYTITTYGTFAKKLLDLTDEQLKIEFDHSIFIVDEVHNLNDDKSGGTLKKNAIGNEYYAKTKKNKKSGMLEEKIIESHLIYNQLWRLFHTVFPRKVMLLSATPMINDPSELGPRLNLILPRNNQIPENLNWNTVTLDTLEPYFRGLISYVRALDTGAIPVYQGEVIKSDYTAEEIQEGKLLRKEKGEEEEEEGEEEEEEEEKEEEKKESIKAQMVIYPSKMAEKQEEVYQRAIDDPSSLRPDSDKPEAFDDLKRQAANFIFPDNSTGSVGYRKYVKEEKNTFTPTNEFRKWLSSPETLNSMSCKFYEIVRLCKEEAGNCWCYSNYIRGAGAIVLGLCFEAQGFERFTESGSIFTTKGSEKLSSLCGAKSLDDSDIKKERNIRIAKRLRYGLLTSETSGPETATLLEAFNSYENRHGEYIKAIIGSPVTRDGLNLANVLQIHLSGPGWNQASSYQAESRAIRSTSHVDLLEEEKERLRLKGENPENVSITIKVYRHAAVNDEGTSIDVEMYQLSEIKDRQIKRIMRMMKQVAVDCQINYTRNVRVKDIDGTAVCDYDACAYKCYDPSPKDIDYTSYDVLYNEEIVEIIKSEIIDIFRVIFQIPYETLYSELSSYRRKFIDMAISDLIEKKVKIIDRFGYASYLREDRGTLFLKTDYPLNLFEKEGAVSVSEYSSYLLGISTMSLNEYNGSLQRGKGSVLNIFKGMDSEEILEKIEELTLENQILLLETAITSYYTLGGNKEEKEIEILVIDKFKNFVYFTYEPVEALKLSNKFLMERGKGRGRKAKKDSKFKFNETQENEVRQSAKKVGKTLIYFHTLSTLSQSLTSYSIAAKSRKAEGKVRLLNSNEKIGWRDANEYEELTYNLIAKMKIEESEIKNEIYGTILKDGKFRIVDRTTEDKDLTKTDGRKKNRGRVCNTWQKPELIQLMWKLKYNPFKITVDLNRSQLIQMLISQKIIDSEETDNMSDEQLKFYYTWSSSGANISKICELLQEHLEETDRMQ